MTHINAYYGAVEEAKAKVYAAQSELELAQRNLADKLREEKGEPEEKETPKPVEQPEEKGPSGFPFGNNKKK